MKTLQEQYNLIKEGKGNKEILLKTAKQLYPNIIPNHFTYNQAVPLLKQRGLLHESIGGVVTKGTDPDWFAIFKENINEAKAIEKKPTKDVVDMETRGYDYKNKENIDNVYGQAFLIGYYAEMKDPANADKTVDDLKAIVAKNLYKDPLYYVKNGQFGVKGVGYTDEAPGLTASKTDQMTPVPDQVKPKASKTDLGDREKKTGAAKKVKGEMTVTPKSSKGVKKMPLPGKEKKIKLQEAWDTRGQGYGEDIYDYMEKVTILLKNSPELTGIDNKDVSYKIEGDKIICKDRYSLEKVQNALNIAEVEYEYQGNLIIKIGDDDINPAGSWDYLQEIMSPSQLAKYADMSDQEIMNWAKQDGMEELIIPDEEGGLANREELLTALLGLEMDNYPMDDYDDDDDMINPAGTVDYFQEQKIRSVISQLIKEELEEMQGFRSSDTGEFGDGPQPPDDMDMDLTPEEKLKELHDEVGDTITPEFMQLVKAQIKTGVKLQDAVVRAVDGLYDKYFFGGTDIDEVTEPEVDNLKRIANDAEVKATAAAAQLAKEKAAKD